MNPILVVVAILALSACQSRPQDTDRVVSSDPGLAAEAALVLEGLPERAGLPLVAPVRVETRSREELEAFLRVRLDQELPEDETAALTDAYALLGLVPPGLDVRSLLLSVYGEQVAGFYDPDSTALFLLDDQPEDARQTLLVHELVHAIQDQATSLDSITDRSLGNDRQVAAQSAIEGHATLVMLESMMAGQGMDVDLGQVPDFASTLRPALEAMRGQYPALASAPLLFQEGLLFPYLGGATFVQTLWQSADPGARPAPFGDRLPRSTEQVLEPARFLSVPRDEPTDVTLSFDGGVTPRYENDLGALETGILLRTLVGDQAEQGRVGWDGDRYALLDVDGTPALVWASVWDDGAARDRFVELLMPALPGLGGPARLESDTVDGRPVALLLVGPAPRPLVVLEGGLP